MLYFVNSRLTLGFRPLGIDIEALLGDYRTRIQTGIDVVDRDTHPRGMGGICLSDGIEPPEVGKQGGMDVYDPVFICFKQDRRDNAHVSCKDDPFDLLFLQPLQDCPLVIRF